MSFVTYVSGVVGLAIIVGAWAIAGRSTARSLTPTWSFPLRALAATTVAISGVLVTSQIVGTFGLFRRGVLVLASIIGAVIVNNVVRRRAPERADIAAPQLLSWRRLSTPAKFAVVAGCIVVAQWAGGSLGAYQHGIADPDSQHYHLAHAARFVQDHRTTSMHYVSVDDGATYHPANTELLHAVGMLEMRSDVMSAVLNFALLPFALLAAYCVGRKFNSGPASLIGMVLLTALPIAGKQYAATAGNDYGAIAFFIAACAFALHAVDDDDRGAAYVFAGLAAGLAIGTKLTMVVPVAGLTLTMLWILRRRLIDVARFAVPLAAVGSYWFVRNLVHVGSPVPTLNLGVFPSPPMKLIKAQGFAVTDYLNNSHFLRHTVPSGMKDAFGVGWPITLLVAGVGLLLVLFATRQVAPRTRALLVGIALTGGATLAAYLVTPTTAGGPKGDPYLFQYNIRYMLPGLMMGTVFLPAIPVLRDRQRQICVAGLALIGLTLLGPPHLEAKAVVLAVVLLVGVFVATMVGFRSLVALSTLAAIGVAVIGFPLVRHYQRTRFDLPSSPRVALFHYGNTIPPGSRVAIVGLPLQFAFDGPRFQNRVDYLGVHRAHHEFTDYTTCKTWRTALRDGRYNYVIAEPIAGAEPAAAEWTATDSSAHVVLTTAAGTIFQLSAPADPLTC